MDFVFFVEGVIHFIDWHNLAIVEEKVLEIFDRKLG